MPATIIVDAFWGDSGKGKVTAHLSRLTDAGLAVRAGVGTNAGASFTLDDDTVAKHRQVPTAWVNPRTTLAVGPGVLVHPDILAEEVDRYAIADRIVVDPRCGLITEQDLAEDAADEFLREVVGTSGSGVGPARARYVNRKAQRVADLTTVPARVADVAELANTRSAAGETVLVEGAQGTQLSLSLSFEYPCTTVKNCTSAAAMDDVGLSWRQVSDVVLVVKALPSRVGEGPLPYEMSHAEAVRRGIAEYGVNTGRPRRKASRIDDELLRYATLVNGPTQVALTFADHLDPRVKGVRHRDGLTDEVRAVIAQVERITEAPVTMVDTGPYLSDLVDLPTD